MKSGKVARGGEAVDDLATADATTTRDPASAEEKIVRRFASWLEEILQAS